ncbi:heme A synthase [Pseudoclavibacter endophyticus]|uniref:Heme A synthase n=2 Tax=Pseudoclavibacter endophyticus TaxID=1778590 RepID=A0A6H9WHW8_9MICO|nr:heme A synthase [Pseudoclavibacter endophyticus]
MPQRVTRWTRIMAWASVTVHILIVTTGGLVRLTGSGLGCPTWPMCTEDSLVPTPEMGFHGIIEFGNRTLTGLLCAVALLMFLAVWNTRGSGMRLVTPALWIGILTIVQAVVGGVTVWLELHPAAVGIHFLISAVLVTIASTLLVRVLRAEPVPASPLGASLSGRGLVLVLSLVTAVWVWVTVYVGSLTTGSGPHAGDEASARNGLDPELMQHLHSYPAYILLVCAIVLVWLSVRSRIPGAGATAIGVLALVVAQAVIGVWQSNTGLPIGLVSAHMTLSCVTIAVMTANLVVVRRGVAASRVESSPAGAGSRSGVAPVR